MNKTKILNLLGLCARARMITLGEDVVLGSLKHATHKLIFLASDAGNNIKKKVSDKALSFNATLIDTFTTDELSKAIGKENRKLILITDKGFIQKFKEYLES